MAERPPSGAASAGVAVPYAFSPEGYGAVLGDLRRAGYHIVPLCETPPSPPPRGLCVLRHDVDFSLDYALEMARLDAEAGLRSTFLVQLFSPWYRTCDPHGLDRLRAIVRLGHEIGLHWDGRLLQGTAEQRRAALQRDLAFLEGLVGAPIVSVSQHAPADSDPLDTRGIAAFDPYREPFLHPLIYVSDSNMAWRVPFHELIAGGRSLHILLHPVWWMASGENMPAKIQASFALERARLDDIERGAQDFNRGGVERRAARDAVFAARYRRSGISLTTDAAALAARIDVQARGQERDLNAWILDLCRPAPGERVLDLGCGTGSQLVLLARAVGAGGRVVGVDASAEALRAAREAADGAGLTNVDLIRCDLEEVPAHVPPGPYDLVHAAYAIYYAKDPAGLVAHLARWLRAPAGRIFLCGYDAGNNQELFDLVNRYLPAEARAPGIPAPFLDAEEVDRAFAGLSRVTHHRLTNPVRFADAGAVMLYWRNYAQYRPGADEAIEAALRQATAGGATFVMTKRILGLLAEGRQENP
jgi:SAM-dependent methyltransferase